MSVAVTPARGILPRPARPKQASAVPLATVRSPLTRGRPDRGVVVSATLLNRPVSGKAAGRSGATGHAGAVHEPDVQIAGGMSPQEIGLVVSVEVADSLDRPFRRHVERCAGGAGDGRAVHEPDIGRPRDMAPQDVGLA